MSEGGKSHVKRFFGKDRADGDGEPTENRDVWIDVLRVDKWTEFIRADAGYMQKIEVNLEWMDGPDDPPEGNPSRAMRTLRVVGPDENRDDPDTWIEIPVIKKLGLYDVDQFFVYEFYNARSNNTARIADIRRVMHRDTTIDPSDNPDGEPYAFEPDTKDSDQYIDIDITRMFAVEDVGDLQRSLVWKDTRWLTLGLDKRPDDFDSDEGHPPSRLDPFQVIINCQFAPKDLVRPVQVVVGRYVQTGIEIGPTINSTAYETVVEFPTNIGGPYTDSQPADNPFYIIATGGGTDSDTDANDWNYVELVRDEWPERPTHSDEVNFDDWPAPQNERGRFIMSYADGDDSWDVYASSRGIDWYKNNEYDSRYGFDGINYAKKVSQDDEAEALLELTEEQAADAIHVSAKGVITVINGKTAEFIKEIIPGDPDCDDDDIDPIFFFGRDSDIDGSVYGISENDVDDFGVGETSHHIYKWDKYGRYQWSADSPITPRLRDLGTPTNPAVINVACVGRCFCFLVESDDTNLESQGAEDGTRAYPFDFWMCAVNSNGDLVLNEHMSRFISRQDVDNSYITTGFTWFHGIGGNTSGQSGVSLTYECVYPRFPVGPD